MLPQKRSREPTGGVEPGTSTSHAEETVPAGEHAVSKESQSKESQGSEPLERETPSAKRARRSAKATSRESVRRNEDATMGEARENERPGSDANGATAASTAEAKQAGSATPVASAKRVSKRLTGTRKPSEARTEAREEPQGDVAAPTREPSTTKRARKSITARVPDSASANIATNVPTPEVNSRLDAARSTQQSQQEEKGPTFETGRQALRHFIAESGVRRDRNRASPKNLNAVSHSRGLGSSAGGAIAGGSSPNIRVQRNRNGTVESAAQRPEQAGVRQQQQQQRTQPLQHTPSLNPPADGGSPARGVPSVNLREIEEHESPHPSSTPSRRLDPPADEPGFHGFMAKTQRWIMRGRASAWALRNELANMNPRTLHLAVRNSAVRMVMFLSFVYALRFLWFIVPSVTGISQGGSGGRHGGSATPREVVLALLEDSEPFRAFQAAEAEHRDQGSEIHDRITRVMESLNEARKLQETLRQNMNLLRVQAQGGLASRGLPENPEVSEQISLSQMKELQYLKVEVHDSAMAARRAVEDSHSWTDDVNVHAPIMSQGLDGASAQDWVIGEDEEELIMEQARDASDQWLTELSAPIRSKFKDLKEVYEDFLTWWEPGPQKAVTKEEGEQLARHVRETVPSASASIARAPSPDNTQERVLAEVQEQVRRNRARDSDQAASKTHESSVGLSMPTPQPIPDLVAREVEVMTSGGTGMPDYASIRTGAAVVHGSVSGHRGRKELLTTESYAKTGLNWFDYALYSLGFSRHLYAEGPEAALSMDTSPGSCFAFEGGVGRLTVQLSLPRKASRSSASGTSFEALGTCSASRGRQGDPSCSSIPVSIPCSEVNKGSRSKTSGDMGEDVMGYNPRGVKVTHVSLEHTRVAATRSTKSAPGFFRVFGWVDDPSKNAQADLGRYDAASGKDGSLRPHVLLDRAEFIVGEGALGVQTFAVSDVAREAAPPVRWVTLEIESNHGATYTCLYGFRVHGDGVILPV